MYAWCDGAKKRSRKPRGNVGFLLSCFICACKCTRMMTFMRWKECVYWARSCHVSSPLIFASRFFFLLKREHLLKINLWNEDHSWGFTHSPSCQLFGLEKSVTGKWGKTRPYSGDFWGDDDGVLRHSDSDADSRESLPSHKENTFLRSRIYGKAEKPGGNGNHVTPRWIPGHSGLTGNEKADQVAKCKAGGGGKQA